MSGLANLGITMSTNYDGTLSFDPTVLTSALNSDYSGVLGFFQNMNSWGRTFSTILNNAGHDFVERRFDPGREMRTAARNPR